MLIAEAVKIGVITAAAAQLYRGEIRQARDRPSAKQQDKKRQSANDNESDAERTSPFPTPDKSDAAKQGRIYVTYTKFNRKTGRYYSGRTSMVIDLERPHYPQALKAVDQRDANHHLDENDEPKNPAFVPAQIDVFDVGTAVEYRNRYEDLAYFRIRGREQQLMDSFGGAWSDTGEPYKTENALRGVAKANPQGRRFHEAATSYWGKKSEYTGD